MVFSEVGRCIFLPFGQSQASCFPQFLVFMLSKANWLLASYLTD